MTDDLHGLALELLIYGQVQVGDKILSITAPEIMAGEPLAECPSNTSPWVQGALSANAYLVAKKQIADAFGIPEEVLSGGPAKTGPYLHPGNDPLGPPKPVVHHMSHWHTHWDTGEAGPLDDLADDQQPPADPKEGYTVAHKTFGKPENPVTTLKAHQVFSAPAQAPALSNHAWGVAVDTSPAQLPDEMHLEIGIGQVTPEMVELLLGAAPAEAEEDLLAGPEAAPPFTVTLHAWCPSHGKHWQDPTHIPHWGPQTCGTRPSTPVEDKTVTEKVRLFRASGL